MLLVAALTLGGAMLLIQRRAGEAADQAINQSLIATRSAIEDALAGQSRTLRQTARVLAQVPSYLSRVDEGLRRGNHDDLLDQADEFRAQSGAAWALVADHAGVLQASTRMPGAFGDTLGGALIERALEGEEVEGVWIEGTAAGDSLFQAVSVPLAAAGAPASGVVILAHALDQAFAERLKRQTGSEVIFAVFDTLGRPHLAATTLPGAMIEPALQARYSGAQGAEGEMDSVPARLTVEAGGQTWIATAGPLTLASGQIVGEYAGLRAREAALAPFVALQRSVMFAFLGALGAALAFSLLLARQITRPLRRLVAITREVAEGRYAGTVEIRSRDEVGELAEAFRRMLAELREKQRLVEFLGSTSTPAPTQLLPTAPSAPGQIRIGGVLAGRYEIRQQLGQGGMGVVYRAFDQELREPVAIKTLRPELVGDPALLERFKQEIRLARRIAHPNVVRTHDLGEAGGMYFITMEFVEGTSLDELLRRRGALPLPVALTVGRQLCRALEVAHEQGVVHRDIKPQNLVVDGQGFLKVMDFGIARLIEGRQTPAGSGLTADGTVIGTPEYMAPEQLMGQPVDGRADLYAAGLVLYECVTGARPFQGESFGTVLLKQVQEPPPDPRLTVPDLPEAFVLLVLRALAKAPDERWPGAAAMLRALEAIPAPGKGDTDER